MTTGSEREISHAIRLAVGRHPTARMFRNQVGQCHYITRAGEQRHLSYGLAVGSSDLIGWRTIQLPAGPIAQFVALELKSQRGILTPEQRMFLANVERRGGLAGVCRSVDEALALLEQPWPGAATTVFR